MITVVGIKLGCINHAVLTAQAVQQAGLTLAGWIANDVTPPGRRHQEYGHAAPYAAGAAAGRNPASAAGRGGRRWGSIWISACWRSEGFG